MRRRRKGKGKYGNKMHAQLIRVSGKRVSSQMCAVRFYWAGSKHSNHKIASSKQELVTCRLAIRGQVRRATPTQVMAELTLGELISSWMRWLYVRQDRSDGTDTGGTDMGDTGTDGTGL
jgi:hypothetical protein